MAATLARRRLIANGLLAAVVLVGAALAFFPPGPASFYPQCPVREYLHIDCPGCGATRALAALLRGQVLLAIRLNALFVVLLPFAVVGAGECYRRAVGRDAFRWPVLPAPAGYAAILAALVFMIARNLPG